MFSRIILSKSTSLRFIIKNNGFVRYFYDSTTKNDTIFAPLTTIQTKKGSPLGVIRVSGNKTEHVLEKFTKFQLLRQTNGRISPNSKTILPRYAKVAKIFSPTSNNDEELIDIGLVLWFPKPNSYTGEDSCEFHLHGSQSIQTKMLSDLGSLQGLRPAEAGEFTKRAVQNGKMSLLEAESLPDLIASNTDYQRKLALKGLDQSTRNKYEHWITSLIDILAHLEASIDFGEDELIGEQVVVKNCIDKLNDLNNMISRFIETSTQCKEFVQAGARVVILGKPNAGKSTLMNLLCQKDKSIVSNLSGTTRDVVEHTFELGGHAITLSDTAGLSDIDNNQFISNTAEQCEQSSNNLIEQHKLIEQAGIRRALKVASKADVIIYLLDGSKLTGRREEEFVEVAEEVSTALNSIEREKSTIAIYLMINKIDLNNNDLSSRDCEIKLKQAINSINSETKNSIIKTNLISCKSGENFNQFIIELTECLNELAFKTIGNLSSSSSNVNNNVNNKHVSPSSLFSEFEFDYVNERHLSLLRSTQRNLERANKLNLDTIDEMAQHVRESLDYLSRIVGSITNEQVIDVIFRDFCIGK